MGCHPPKSQSEEGTRTPTFLMSPDNVEILGSVTLWKGQFGGLGNAILGDTMGQCC